MISPRIDSTSVVGPQLARAIVSDSEDPEKKGRIKVEYPWFPEESSSQPSEWARLMTPYASQSAGWVSIPQIGDEVLVFFENGNFDLPIVLGGLFSQKNPLPRRSVSGTGAGSDSGNRPEEVAYMKTRQGHSVYFDDSSAGSGIKLETRSGQSLDLSDAESSIGVRDVSGNQIEMNEEGIQIRNSGGVQIQLKGSRVQVLGAQRIELGEGALEALVKGKTFLEFFNTHTHPHPLGPTSPPTVPLQAAMVLSQKVHGE